MKVIRVLFEIVPLLAMIIFAEVIRKRGRVSVLYKNLEKISGKKRTPSRLEKVVLRLTAAIFIVLAVWLISWTRFAMIAIDTGDAEVNVFVFFQYGFYTYLLISAAVAFLILSFAGDVSTNLTFSIIVGEMLGIIVGMVFGLGAGMIISLSAGLKTGVAYGLLMNFVYLVAYNRVIPKWIESRGKKFEFDPEDFTSINGPLL